MSLAGRKDQVFNIIYASEERPDPSNLALVKAVQKVASLWAVDAREALALFDLKPPKKVHYVVAVQPGGVDRGNWVEVSEEERRRAAGKMIVGV